MQKIKFMNKHENQSPQNENAATVALDAVVPQDRINGLLFENLVRIRASLDAIAEFQIRALSQTTNVSVSDLEKEFQELRDQYVLVHAQSLREQVG